MGNSSTSPLYPTGATAPHTGNYQFVKYSDGTTSPSPTLNERIISLTRGERFPPINSTDKGAYWQAI
jgi:hypothetical protein